MNKDNDRYNISTVKTFLLIEIYDKNILKIILIKKWIFFFKSYSRRKKI